MTDAAGQSTVAYTDSSLCIAHALQVGMTTTPPTRLFVRSFTDDCCAPSPRRMKKKQQITNGPSITDVDSFPLIFDPALPTST